MFSRRVLFVPVFVVLAILIIVGGLAYWTSRDVDEPPLAITPVVGPDVPPTPAISGVSNGEVPLLNEDFLRAVEAALREQLAAEEYARARAEGEAVADDAIQRWGRGQMLLAMPSIGTTAAAQPMGYERDGRTPAVPNSRWGLGWYTFTDEPGSPGNAVFAGHVDWYTGEPAVFGRLRNLELGDTLYVVLADGTPVAYQVQRSEWVTPRTADVGEIFGITADEAITLITCGGTWDPVAKDYSHRLIVRAHRVW